MWDNFGSGVDSPAGICPGTDLEMSPECSGASKDRKCRTVLSVDQYNRKEPDPEYIAFKSGSFIFRTLSFLLLPGFVGVCYIIGYIPEESERAGQVGKESVSLGRI